MLEISISHDEHSAVTNFLNHHARPTHLSDVNFVVHRSDRQCAYQAGQQRELTVRVHGQKVKWVMARALVSGDLGALRWWARRLLRKRAAIPHVGQCSPGEARLILAHRLSIREVE